MLKSLYTLRSLDIAGKMLHNKFMASKKVVIGKKYFRRMNASAIPAETLGKISGKPASFFTQGRIEDIQILLDIACGVKKVIFNKDNEEAGKTVHIYEYMELIAEYGKAVEIINRTVDYELRPKGRYIIKKLMDELLSRDLTEMKESNLTKSIKEIAQALKEIEIKESIGMELEIESSEDVESKRKQTFRIITSDPALREKMENFLLQNEKEQEIKENAANG